MTNQVRELAQYLLGERVGLVVIEATGDYWRNESDLRVHGFDAPVGEAVFDGGEDRGAVVDDAALEFHERRDPAPARPANPLIEGFGWPPHGRGSCYVLLIR